MEDEPIDPETVRTALCLIGIAAGVVATFATGGLSFIAGAFAVACLAGSAATCFMAAESPCEGFCRESDESAPRPAAEEPAISQSLDAEPSHRWRQAVKANRNAGRNR